MGILLYFDGVGSPTSAARAVNGFRKATVAFHRTISPCRSPPWIVCTDNKNKTHDSMNYNVIFCRSGHSRSSLCLRLDSGLLMWCTRPVRRYPSLRLYFICLTRCWATTIFYKTVQVVSPYLRKIELAVLLSPFISDSLRSDHHQGSCTLMDPPWWPVYWCLVSWRIKSHLNFETTYFMLVRKVKACTFFVIFFRERQTLN